MVPPKYGETFGHRAAPKVGKSVNDDAGWLAAGMRIDRSKSSWQIHLFKTNDTKYSIVRQAVKIIARVLVSKTSKHFRMKKIMAMIGSLSSRSSNLLVVEHISSLLNDKFQIEIYDGIRHLPQFNPDLEGDALPAEVKELRDAISDADLVLISTPEYVFGVPGSLKNALDWTVSTADFREKPIALVVAALSGEKAFESLLKTVETLEAVMCDGCSLLISHIKAKIGTDGKIIDSSTRIELERFAESITLCLEK